MNFKNHLGDIIEIIYQDKSGQLSQRVVRIVEVKGVIVKAYCYKRQQVRFFIKENILGSNIVKHRGNVS